MPDPRERDPRFPDRPTHPDFIKLSEVVQEYDDRAENKGEDPFALTGVDEESLLYLIRNRFGIFGQRTDRERWFEEHEMFLMALYLDAFALGAAVTRGHAEDAIEHFFEGKFPEPGLAGNLARRVRKAMRDGSYPPPKPERGQDASI